MKDLIEHNIRLVFVSATMQTQIGELMSWGDHHQIVKMTIPENYMGHDGGIIRDYYEVNDLTSAERWIKEDILDNYGIGDPRVSTIRTTERNRRFIRDACAKFDIEYHDYTSKNKITPEEMDNIFMNVTKHTVIAVKGLLTRSDLIPNKWKLKAGAVMERKIRGNNVNITVNIQGLPGRYTGYWKDVFTNNPNHKFGPIRCSMDAVRLHEAFYANPEEVLLGTTSGNFVGTKRKHNNHS